jgi:ribosome-binding protein aMBF1 (putative translation factor)
MLQEEKAVEEGLDQGKAGEEISPEMGMRLKKAREGRGLSIFDIYLRTNIPVDQLSQIEEGKVIPPLGTVSSIPPSG